MRTKQEIIDLIDEEDIKFIRLQFTDMYGELKNIAVTASQLERVLNNRFTLSDQALYGSLACAGEDVYLHPDLSSLVVLPWRPQHGKVARLLCDVYTEDGKPHTLCPRTILKKVIDQAAEKGYTFYVDPDCEFFLFHSDENGMPTTVTHEKAGYMDVGPTDFGENIRRDIVLSLEEMGFEVESSHHENAPAQHEIDFKEAEPMQIADSIVTFKSAVRSTAKRFGMHATFMPKPKKGVAGSGMHLNISVYKDGRNLFNMRDSEGGVRQEAKWFMGGIIEHVESLCAITNPTVNSYKRLMTGFDAPKYIVWTQKNNNALLKVRHRLDEDTKIDLRFPDPSANPYLAIAVCLAAGIYGIEHQIQPGEESSSVDENGEVRQLPGTLREAVVHMKNSSFMAEILGEEFVSLYISKKMEEWDAYMEQVSDWELNEYLYKI